MLQPRNSVVNFYRFCLTGLSILNSLPSNVLRHTALAGLAIAIAACTTIESKPKEEVVKQRAQARADAMVAGDYKAVYEFFSPAARQSMKYENFVQTVRMGLWKGATVDKVHCSSEELCDVDLTVDYQHRMGRFKGPLRQSWLKEQNNWYLVVKE